MAGTGNKLKQRLMEKNKNIDLNRAPILQNSNSNHEELFRKLKEAANEKLIERLERDNKKTVYRINIYNLVESPADWNYFSPLNDDKMVELIDSIKTIGLQSPIIVWELPQEDGEEKKYRILSGHNRTRAYKEIYEKEKNEEYLFIPCIIYQKDDLNEQEAKDIIVDSNYISRVLTAREKTLSIKHKYLLYKSRRESKPMEKVAKEMNLKIRTIKYYLTIGQLDDEIKELVFSDLLTIRDAANLAKLSNEAQRWLVEKHKDKITNEFCRKVKTTLTTDELERLLSGEGNDEQPGEEENYITLSFRVHASLEEELKRKVEKWIKKKTENRLNQ